MKEMSKSAVDLNTGAGKTVLVDIAWQLLFALFGFIGSKTAFPGGMIPLGAAFTAASPVRYIFSTFIGSAVGYIFPLETAALRYVAASAAVAAVKLTVSRFTKESQAGIWSFISTVILLFLTGVAVNGGSTVSILKSAAEGVIGGIAAYFAASACALTRKEKSVLKSKSRIALLITVCFVTVGLYSVGIGKFTVGAVLSVAVISVTGQYGGAGSGAMCGAAFGISAYLADSDPIYAVLFTAAGICSGMAGGYGKVAVSSCEVLISVLIYALAGFPVGSSGVLASLTAGSAFYLLIPASLASRIAMLTGEKSIQNSSESIRKSVSSRLSFASDALKSVGAAITEASEKMRVTDTPTLEKMMKNVAAEACAECGYFGICWQKEYPVTEKAVLSMAKLTDGADRCEFAVKCPRKERVEASAVMNYTVFLRDSKASGTAAEIRAALDDQLAGLSEMLGDLSDEFENMSDCDTALSSALSDAASAEGLIPRKACCFTDRDGRMHIEMTVTVPADSAVNRSRIRSAAEEICGRQFEIPEITRVEGGQLIAASERAVYAPDISYVTLKSDGEHISGDTADTFSDGRGKTYMVLCDGMGSGVRAAADSNMTCGMFYRLICSGFGFSCALRFINSAMMYRSCEESFSTLDVAAIDLFDGNTEIFKAGSAPTVILKNGKTGKAECRSLPVGILREVKFDRVSVKLSDGDVILMMSDGAAFDGVSWICEELEKWKGGSAAKLSEHIAGEARSRRKDGRSDDITVIAAIMRKAI